MGVGMGDFDPLVPALTLDHDDRKIGQAGNRASGSDPNGSLVTPRLVQRAAGLIDQLGPCGPEWLLLL
jgi:hypothetical protein